MLHSLLSPRLQPRRDRRADAAPAGGGRGAPGRGAPLPRSLAGGGRVSWDRRGLPRSVRRAAALVRAFRLLARRASIVVHPTPASLVRYRAGELPSERQREIQEHFLFCPLCPELLLDLALFTPPRPRRAAELAADLGLAQAWRALRARLGRSRT